MSMPASCPSDEGLSTIAMRHPTPNLRMRANDDLAQRTVRLTPVEGTNDPCGELACSPVLKLSEARNHSRRAIATPR
jgi:hypothetical protein